MAIFFLWLWLLLLLLVGIVAAVTVIVAIRAILELDLSGAYLLHKSGGMRRLGLLLLEILLDGLGRVRTSNQMSATFGRILQLLIGETVVALHQ